MTIHRALAELKLIDDKISKQTTEINPTAIRQPGKLLNGVYEENDFNASAIGKYDSVIAMIARKGAIKSAIVSSNGHTFVNIGGQSMTVADAINAKNAIVFKRGLIDTLKLKQNKTIAGLNQQNDIIQANCQKIMEAAYGKDAIKNSTADVVAFQQDYLEKNSFVMADPLKVQTKIDALELEVSTFEMEVDAVLSESNAITQIEI